MKKTAKPKNRKAFPSGKQQISIIRLSEFIHYLQSSGHTVKHLANRFDCAERTVYRYFKLIEKLELGLDQDFSKRWFIARLSSCPFCGSKTPIPTEVNSAPITNSNTSHP